MLVVRAAAEARDAQFSTRVIVFFFYFVSAKEDKNAERYFPREHPLSVLWHGEIQQEPAYVCSPPDFMFEELHTQLYNQSAAQNTCLNVSPERRVELCVWFIKQAFGSNFLKVKTVPNVHCYHKHPQSAEFIIIYFYLSALNSVKY